MATIRSGPAPTNATGRQVATVWWKADGPMKVVTNVVLSLALIENVIG
jgi:hypothetical protein